MRTSAPDVVGEEFVSAGADGVEVGIPSGHGSAQGGVLYRARLEVPCRVVVINHVSEPRTRETKISFRAGWPAQSPVRRTSTLAMYAESKVICSWYWGSLVMLLTEKVTAAAAARRGPKGRPAPVSLPSRQRRYDTGLSQKTRDAEQVPFPRNVSLHEKSYLTFI